LIIIGSAPARLAARIAPDSGNVVIDDADAMMKQFISYRRTSLQIGHTIRLVLQVTGQRIIMSQRMSTRIRRMATIRSFGHHLTESIHMMRNDFS
jgi:hypothetical protein